MSIPGVLTDFNHFKRVVATDAWKASVGNLDKQSNIHILHWGWNVGSQYLWTSKGPAQTLSDFKGQKTRYTGGESTARVLEAWGMAPIALDFTEVVTSLQTKMIDGLVTDLGGGVSFYKLQDKAPYLFLVPVVLIPQFFVVNGKWWSSLPKDAREAIQGVFDKIDTEPWVEMTLNQFLKEWKADPKLHTTEPNAAELQKWLDAAKPAIQKLTSTIDPKYLQAVESVR